ncbi:sensor histidine kinase [Nonomuraea turcica]|uniref:sensor histidine kinase n=1 Tax=Nonomuraea sp. G32 TaxID=3067274 RepID=UPI00273A8278|nr:histidine kinase [Nonomuraea sp. G32]MDP4505474.1 histidine kinase [Nonomuraea sp. G32]
MPSTTTARSLFATRPSSRTILDAAITALVLAASLARLSHGGAAHLSAHDLDLIGAVLATFSALPLLLWRRFTLGVFLATAAASVAMAGIGYPDQPIGGPAAAILGPAAVTLAPTVALYLLAASRDRAAPWTMRTTGIVVGVFAAYVSAAAVAQAGFPWLELLHTGLAWAVAWFAGERTRLRREQMAVLEQRALLTAQQAERDRQLAVAEERARIARDLHDAAGHAISLIAVRAGAARLRHHQDPDRSLRALETIEELARQTAAEIDQVVGTLREPTPANGAVEVPPGLASLDTLIARHTATGLEVMLTSAGRPRPLAATADRTVYRILQEALTNAARHGTGSATVEIMFREATVELTVTNPVRAGGTPRSGGGHGLIGMLERARLLGGSLDTEQAGGTFRLHASLPDRGHHA